MLNSWLIKIEIFYHRYCGYRPDEWALADPFNPKILVDGSVSRGPLMKRFVDGHREYRQLTDHEESWRAADASHWI